MSDASASPDLFVRRFGDGAVPVLAVHCALASGRALQPLARALPEATLTTFDLPGHGRSAELAADGSADDQGAAATFAASLLHDQSAHVVGHSFGATVALGLALAHPDRVRSLTLIEPVLFAALRGTPDWDEVEARQQPFQRALDAGDRAQAAHAFHGMWGGGGPSFDDLPAPVRAGWLQRIHLIAEQRPALYEDRAGLLRPGGLEGLSMPVTLLHGADSPSAIRAIEDALAQRLPFAQRVRVPDAGHMVAITHAVPVAQAVRATIARAT